MTELETLLKVLDSEVREVPNFKGTTYITLKELGTDPISGGAATKAFVNGPVAMAKINDSLVISTSLDEHQYVVIILHPHNIDLKVVPKEAK